MHVRTTTCVCVCVCVRMCVQNVSVYLNTFLSSVSNLPGSVLWLYALRYVGGPRTLGQSVCVLVSQYVAVFMCFRVARLFSVLVLYRLVSYHVSVNSSC